MVVEEVVWKIDAIQRIEHGLDHVIAKQPEVAAEHLAHLLFGDVDASVCKLLPGEVAPTFEHSEAPLEIKRRAAVLGQRAYFRLVVAWLRVAVLVRDDVRLDLVAIEVWLAQKALQILGGHEVFLPDIAQLRLVDCAHVREDLPDRNPLVVGPQAVRHVLHLPLACLRVRLVRLACALFDERPLEHASAVTDGLPRHVIEALTIAHAPRKLDKLILDRRGHGLARCKGHFLLKLLHVDGVRVLARLHEHRQCVL